MNKIPVVVIVIGIIIILAGIFIILNIEDDAIETIKEGYIYEGSDGEMNITGENDTKPHLYVHIKSKFVGGKTGGYNERHGDNTWNLTQEDCDLVRNFTLTNDDSDQVFIPKCNYVEDIAGDDEWIVVGTLCTQQIAGERNVTGNGCPDGTYTWDTGGEEVMVYDGDLLGEMLGDLLRSLLGSFGACCCGVGILLIGIILAFTMEDTKATYENNQNSNLFNQAAAETGLKSTSGWDEQEDYIRKDSTKDETKEEAPETDQRKGDYKIPPPE